MQHATRDHILSVALFCCALHGSIDPTMDALIREENPIAALDLAEQRGYDVPGNLPRAEVEWPSASGGHVHVWLPWVSGEEARAIMVPPGASPRRCTCGLFEHEPRYLREIEAAQRLADHLFPRVTALAHALAAYHDTPPI
jgi:hypothetical protein